MTMLLNMFDDDVLFPFNRIILNLELDSIYPSPSPGKVQLSPVPPP
jgi:hypothetical protein